MPTRNWFRFSLRTLLIAITVLCVWLAWRADRERERQRFLCSTVIDNALLSIHWQHVSEDLAAIRPAIAKFAQDLTERQTVRHTFLRPGDNSNLGVTLNDLEHTLLSDWSSSGSSVFSEEFLVRKSFFDGSFTYYKAIRARKAMCVSCHQNAVSNIGDLIAIVRIEIE